MGEFIGGPYQQNPTANYDPKEGNYMFLHTYTFTIDIVPLVLENYYFAGLIIGYKGIIVKICLWTKHKVDSVQGKR